MTSILDILKLIVGRRWRVIAIIFAIELVAIVIVSNSAFFPGESSLYEKQYNNIKPVLNQSAAGQVVGIFANNFRVAIAELIPVIGPILFGLSIYETARIVEVIGIVNGLGVGAALGTLFFLPSTWLELPAYSIAVAESAYFVYAMRRGLAGLLKEVRFLIVNVVLIVGVLIVAAVFEVTEIQLETMFGAPAPLWEQSLVFLTWVPFVAVFAGVIRFWRISRRDAPALEARYAEEMLQGEEAPQVIGGQRQPQPQGEKDVAGSPTSRDEGGATA
ncbi:MAG TPA: stage II sporulation protein M [Nitrososphaerales archaeon]|nr:stage II sporulation protein M [Nitrososphaerales archaeon]